MGKTNCSTYIVTESLVLLPLHEGVLILYYHRRVHVIGIMILALTLHGKGERCTNQGLACRPVIWEVFV